MTSGKHTFTPAGQQRHATYVEVCNWVIRAWDKVKSTTIVNGFRKCGIILEPAADVSSLDDDSAESDTTDANEEQLAAAKKVFCDASDFDSSFDGFDASSDDNVDEWNNLFFFYQDKQFFVTVYYIFKYIFFNTLYNVF